MRLSPSSMWRAKNCSYWVREDVPVQYGQSGPAAIIGTQLGARVERALTGRPSDVEECPEADELFEIWKERYGSPKGWLAEVAFAWNPVTDTVRLLPEGTKREQRRLAPNEMGATLDALVLDGDKVTIYDWKTGRQEGTAPAATNPQLAAYAVCVARHYKVNEVRVVLSHITEDGVHETSHVLDAWDLEIEYPAEVRGIIEHVPSAEPKPGPWCKWCPALAAGCSGPKAIADELVQLRTNKVQPLVIRSPEHAGQMYVDLKAIGAMHEAYEEMLKTYMREVGPIVLPDGKRVGCVPTVRESIDVVSGSKVLEKYELTDCVEMKISKDSITKKVKTRVARGEGAAMTREIMGELRAVNAIKAKETTSYEILKEKNHE